MRTQNFDINQVPKFIEWIYFQSQPSHYQRVNKIWSKSIDLLIKVKIPLIIKGHSFVEKVENHVNINVYIKRDQNPYFSQDINTMLMSIKTISPLKINEINVGNWMPNLVNDNWWHFPKKIVECSSRKYFLCFLFLTRIRKIIYTHINHTGVSHGIY